MKKENIQDAQLGMQKIHSSYNNALYAGVALTLNGLVVLARRIEVCPHSGKKVRYGGYWSVFCGAIEDGESAEQTAVREVFEETKIEIKQEKLQALGLIRELALFRYELDKHEIIDLDYEHTEYGYFKISDIDAAPAPVDMKIARAIQYNYYINL